MQLWHATAYVDRVEMPYYLLVSVGPAGHHLLWGRLIALVAAALTIAAVAAMARRLWGAAAAWASGLFLLANPVFGSFALEARSYTLITLGAAGSAWLLVRLLEGASGRVAVGYTLFLVLATLANVLWIPAIAAHLLFTIVRKADRGIWRRLLCAWAVTAVVAVVVVTLSAHERVQIGNLVMPSPVHLVVTILQLTGSDRRSSPWHLVVFLVAVASLAWAIVRRKKLDCPDGLVLAGGYLLIPPVALFMVSILAFSVFNESYMLAAPLGAALIVGAGAASLARPSRLGRIAPLILVLASLVASVLCISTLVRDKSTRDGYPQLQQAVRAEVTPGSYVAVWWDPSQTGYAGAVSLGLDDAVMWHEAQRHLFLRPGGFVVEQVESVKPWRARAVTLSQVRGHLVLVRLWYHAPTSLPTQCRQVGAQQQFTDSVLINYRC